MKAVSITLYHFDELSEVAKQKAINYHLSFLDSLPEEYENEKGELVSEYVEHSEEDAIDSIEMNEYLFFADGELAHITRYVGDHPLSGTTHFHFHGQNYTV